MGSFRSIVRPGVLTPVGTILATMAVMAAATVTPVPRVDLERYVGRWYEIARYPNRFQKDCARDTTAEYALRPDGRLRVTNRCTKADGSAVVAVGVGRRPEGSAPDGAVFKVRFAPKWLSFIPQVWGDYWILSLPDDYRFAVIGEPSMNYLWILSRTPHDERGRLRHSHRDGSRQRLRPRTAGAHAAVVTLTSHSADIRAQGDATALKRQRAGAGLPAPARLTSEL